MDDEDVVELSREEREILMWLGRGYDVAGVAGKMFCSASWIYQRLRVIKEKLAARTDVGAVIEGLRMGVIGFPSREEMKISDE